MFSAKLASLLDKKNQVIGVILLLFALSTLILLNLERQFLPRVDQRQFIIKADLPPGSRLEVTDSVVRKLENLLLKLPETKDVTVNIGSSEERTSAEETALQTLGTHQAQLLVNLKKKSWKDRIYRSTEDVIQYLKNAMDKEDLEGGELEYIAQDTSFGSALEQGAPIAIEIKGPDLAVLSDIAGTLQSHLRKEPGTFGVKTNMPAPSPETKLHILKDKASLFGLSVRDIALTAQVALKGYVATKFKVKQGEEDVDIRVRLRPDDRKDLSNLRRMLIHSPLGMNIAMSDVAFLTRGTGPTEIKRIDQQRSIIVTANAYSRNLKQALAQTNRLIASVKAGLGKDYVLELGGEQRRMRESFQSLAFALILAFALVYMIMAAEFESLWQPFLIMFTIPLSLIGVTAGLILTNTPLSAVAYLGIIMLGGIAVNNGIVLIEFVNELRKQGYSPRDAVLEASKARLRPILMTSLTTILGLLPLAMGLGEGAELQKPLAITVMGGLTSSTFLTLVFIPALYLFVVERFEPQLAAMEIKPLEAGEATLSETPPTPEQTRPSETPARPGLPTPLEVELTRMQKPLPPEAAPKERPRAEKPEHKPELPVVKIELNARQQQLLERLKIAKKITRKEYAETFAISIPTASRDLKELVDKKLLRARGPLGPGRWYELF